MASKLPCVIPTCHEGGFGPWFELDWTGCPNHSMAARHGTYTHVKIKVVLAERKLTAYVYAVGETLQSCYQSGFPAIHFHGLPASATVITCGRGSMRCLDLSRDEPIVIDRTHRTVSLAGWLNDMETIFQRWAIAESEAVCTSSDKGNSLDDMIDAIMEAEVIAYMVQAQAVAPVDDNIVEPINDAGIAEPLFQGGPVWPEDPIPAIPLQEIPLEEAGVDANDNEVDSVEFGANPEDHPEYPLIFIIVSNDEE
ncbi:hypothetical protein TIFTF001_015547 [Ficus carica]|uniref:Uncharacterized protein n=1 Tax=Ficus carica TaxID=3494 RepID=A0AA88D922_FICCA|nr:hypothetical protein TIFTF001_015547 [Ficus carica]